MGGMAILKQRLQQPTEENCTIPKDSIWRPWESGFIYCTRANCGRTFRRESERRRHSETVHDRNIENCQYCSLQFTRKDNLTRHIKMKHKKEVDHRCDFCNKKLSRPDAVHRHMTTCSRNPEKTVTNLKSQIYNNSSVKRFDRFWDREN